MAYDCKGRKRDVAALMADGDTVELYTDGSMAVAPITSVEIARRLGTTPENVRQVQRRIRDDLGWQAC
jgi:hypothetical protein